MVVLVSLSSPGISYFTPAGLHGLSGPLLIFNERIADSTTEQHTIYNGKTGGTCHSSGNSTHPCRTSDPIKQICKANQLSTLPTHGDKLASGRRLVVPQNLRHSTTPNATSGCYQQSTLRRQPFAPGLVTGCSTATRLESFVSSYSGGTTAGSPIHNNCSIGQKNLQLLALDAFKEHETTNNTDQQLFQELLVASRE